MNKITVEDIIRKKGKEKIVMLTCYDYSFASILEETDLDIILVGDSLANVVLGLKETRKVTFKEMLNHTRAVARGAKRALLVADMPYVSYQINPQKAVYYADKFIKAGAEAVKIEWFSKCKQVIKNLVKRKIAVMGHIGLTPQTVHLLGGYKVQGKDRKSSQKLIEEAKILQDLGVFSLVLECIPYQLAEKITKNIKIPTIGIGAGKYCDGQVLVLYDLLGLYKKTKLKFIRQYSDLHREIKRAAEKFIHQVRRGKFPTFKESFSYPKIKNPLP